MDFGGGRSLCEDQIVDPEARVSVEEVGASGCPGDTSGIHIERGYVAEGRAEVVMAGEGYGHLRPVRSNEDRVAVPNRHIESLHREGGAIGLLEVHQIRAALVSPDRDIRLAG